MRCIFVLICAYLCLSADEIHAESVQDHIANERIKLACNVQVAPLTTQIFDECLALNGNPYSLPVVFGPCSEIAGLDMTKYDGIFNYTCKGGGLQANRAKVVSCVVENIGKAAPTMDIIELAKKSLHIAKECGLLVAKKLADEAQAAGAKLLQDTQKNLAAGFKNAKWG